MYICISNQLFCILILKTSHFISLLPALERHLILSAQWRCTSRIDYQTANCNSQHIPIKASSYDLLHLCFTKASNTSAKPSVSIMKATIHKDTEERELCLNSLVLLAPRQHTVMLCFIKKIMQQAIPNFSRG